MLHVHVAQTLVVYISFLNHHEALHYFSITVCTCILYSVLYSNLTFLTVPHFRELREKNWKRVQFHVFADDAGNCKRSDAALYYVRPLKWFRLLQWNPS